VFSRRKVKTFTKEGTEFTEENTEFAMAKKRSIRDYRPLWRSFVYCSLPERAERVERVSSVVALRFIAAT